MTKLRILEIGAGPKPKAHLFYPKELLPDVELIFETMDADEQYEPTYQMDAGKIPEEM